MTHTQFTFERLEVYQAAREALARGIRVRARIKGLPGELCNQLERALLSTVANIAEGAGRETAADQKRHYVIARGSANEAGAQLEVVRLYGVLEESEAQAIRELLLRVVMMLNRMIRK